LQDTQVGKLNSLILIHQIEMVKTKHPYINYHSLSDSSIFYHIICPFQISITHFSTPKT